MPEPTLDERVTGSRQLRRLQAVARTLTHTFARVELIGVDKVPAAGPAILSINHRSMLDGPVVFGFVSRPVSCLVKSEAYATRMRPALVNSGQIPVVRNAVDPRPVRMCLEILRRGGVIGIFPEGTRGDGFVRTVKAGVGYFALRTGAPVFPVACTGTYEMVHRRGARRPLVTLTVGDPLCFDQLAERTPLNRRAVAEATEHIRRAHAALVQQVLA